MTKSDKGLPNLKAPRTISLSNTISKLSSRNVDDILKADKFKTQRALNPDLKRHEGYSKQTTQASGWNR